MAASKISSRLESMMGNSDSAQMFAILIKTKDRKMQDLADFLNRTESLTQEYTHRQDVTNQMTAYLTRRQVYNVADLPYVISIQGSRAAKEVEQVNHNRK